MRDALCASRGRVKQAAGLLGLRFEAFQRINVTTPQPVCADASTQTSCFH
jgi:hypothetical protein